MSPQEAGAALEAILRQRGHMFEPFDAEQAALRLMQAIAAGGCTATDFRALAFAQIAEALPPDAQAGTPSLLAAALDVLTGACMLAAEFAQTALNVGGCEGPLDAHLINFALMRQTDQALEGVER